MRRLGLIFALLTVPCAGLAAEFTTLKGHGGPVMGIAVSETGQVATASFDNAVGLWDGRDPTWLEGHEAAVTTVHFADPSLLLSGSDDFRVLAWAPGLSKVQEIARHKGKVSDIASSAKAKIIASASWDGTIAVRRVVDLLRTNSMTDLLYYTEQTLTGHDAGVNALGFAKETGQLYSASTDGTIRAWDLSSGEGRVVLRHGFGVNRLVLDDAAGWLAYGAVDGVTRVIDLRTEAELHDFTLERRPILAMAYHPGTRQLAVGDGQGYIMMIDTAAWKIVRDFRATRQGPVWALAFSADGGMVYAGGLDDVAYGWPVDAMDKFAPAIEGERSFLRDAATMPNGERQFMRKCSICHALTPGASRKAGPTLHDLFGRRAGTVQGYNYSPILTGADIIWSDDSIGALFDLGPDHYIPGSKMPMQRITAKEDRDDLIAFLKTATQSGE